MVALTRWFIMFHSCLLLIVRDPSDPANMANREVMGSLQRWVSSKLQSVEVVWLGAIPQETE